MEQQIHPIWKPSEKAVVGARSSWKETEIHNFFKILNKMLGRQTFASVRLPASSVFF